MRAAGELFGAGGAVILDTADMEARLEKRIAARVVAELAPLLNGGNGNGHGKAADRWLTLGEIAERLGRSKRTVAAMVKAGEFPKRSAMLHGAHVWRESVVEGWMREREAGQ